MELIPVLLIVVALFWVYQFNSTNSKGKNSIKQIDDKHWIVDGEYVSFDQNDDLYVMQQEHEDSRIWSEYVFYRLTGDCQKINEEYMNVIYHWNYKEGIKEITQEDIDKNKNKYQHYLKMCKALDENIMVLDEKQFSYKEKTPMCCSFRFNMFMPGIYEIHSPDNAKYRDNMTEKLKQEFKEKYY